MVGDDDLVNTLRMSPRDLARFRSLALASTDFNQQTSQPPAAALSTRDKASDKVEGESDAFVAAGPLDDALSCECRAARALVVQWGLEANQLLRRTPASFLALALTKVF